MAASSSADSAESSGFAAGLPQTARLPGAAPARNLAARHLDKGCLSMRALLFSLVLGFSSLLPAYAQSGDRNDDLRRFVNGSWTLTFGEEVKGGAGAIRSVSTVITITMRFDGTRTITQDQTVNDEPPIRTAETHDFYRVDEVDGARFTLTAWSDAAAPSASNRTRTGADQMMAEGSDAVYQRVAGSQETAPGPLPPQRDPPGAAPADATPTPQQQEMDAALRSFMLGTWTATLTKDGQTIESVMQYQASGEVVGTQKITANGASQVVDVKGAYTLVASGEKSFTLTFYLPGLQPLAVALQVEDQNTLFNPAENYRARRMK